MLRILAISANQPGWAAGEAHIPVTSSSGVTHGGPAATLTRGSPASPTLTIMAERVP